MRERERSYCSFQNGGYCVQCYSYDPQVDVRLIATKGDAVT